MSSLPWIIGALLAGQAYAQGTLGGVQYPPCNQAIGQAAQYYGCWDLSPDANNFYNASIVSTANAPAGWPYTYPGWKFNDYYDNSLNPANCTQACRGHGFKYSAMYNGQFCYCGAFPPTVPAPKTSLNPLDTVGNSCHNPGTVCYGDASQYCGSKDPTNPMKQYADVYVDNSFPAVVNPTIEQNNYKYFGCFQSITLSYQSLYGPNATSTYSTAAQCFYTCASLGFAFTQIVSSSYMACQCGTEIPAGYQVANSLCNSNCQGGSGCNPLQTVCCGANGNNPIYINTNLLGCYEPSIPGPSGGASFSAPTGAPTSLGQTTSTAAYPGPVVVATNPPSPPPHIPGFPAYALAGCYERVANLPIISGFTYTDPTSMTVEACFAFCSHYAFSFVSLFNGNTCNCGLVGFSAFSQATTENCHLLCTGNSPPNVYEYCGGSSAEQIYGGPIYTGPIVTLSTATTSTTSTSSSTSTLASSTSTTSSSATGTSSTTLTGTSSSTSTTSSLTTSVSIVSFFSICFSLLYFKNKSFTNMIR